MNIVHDLLKSEKPFQLADRLGLGYGSASSNGVLASGEKAPSSDPPRGLVTINTVAVYAGEKFFIELVVGPSLSVTLSATLDFGMAQAIARYSDQQVLDYLGLCLV